jgi:WD40 repeat protein
MGIGEKSDCRGRRLSALSFNLQTSQLGGDFFIPKGIEGNIRFWSLNDGRLESIIKLGSGESARTIAISRNGNLVGVSFGVYSLGPLDNGIGCYSIKENKWLWKFKWLEDRPSFDRILRFAAKHIIFAQDDTKIIAIGEAHLVIYDASTGEILEKRREPFQDYPILTGCEIRSAFSPSGRYLVIWQEFSTAAHGQWWKRFRVNKSVTVWDIEEKKLIAHWNKQQSEACAAAFSADEKELAFCSNDGYIRVWSIKEQKVIRQWQAYSRSKASKSYPFPNIDFLTLSPDNKYLATKGFDDNGDIIKIWNFRTGDPFREFETKSGGFTCHYPIAFSPDGKYFALERCGNLCLYDTQTWKEKWCIPTSSDGKD